jgi:aspartate aminotransferase
MEKINPSSTLAITSAAKKLKSQGADVVTLAAGEPDFDTPDFIKQEAIRAIESGFTKYTPTTGIPELKSAICDKFKKDNNLEYAPEQIVVSCGAKHSIFNAIFVLAEEKDEVLIPVPYWVSYPEMARLAGGSVRFIPSLPENDFKLKPKEIEKYITSKAKVLILNSPSNPSGCVYTKEELKDIARVCVENKIFVISDEIYEKIIFDGASHSSIGSFGADIYNLTITVNGFSKSHSMTGWRVGYLGAPLDVANAISKLQDHTTSNVSSISQKAALAAVKADDKFSKEMCAQYQQRRDYCMSRLSGMKKISFVKPQGAFYIFCNISKSKMDSVTFAQKILNEEKVALIPGDGFGKDDCIRISFATSIEQLTKGLNRLEAFLNRI